MTVGRTAMRTHQCRACLGRGETHFSPTHEDRPCRACAGTGYITEREYLEWNERGLDAETSTRLRKRMDRAFSDHDDELARLLREAAERLDRRLS